MTELLSYFLITLSGTDTEIISVSDILTLGFFLKTLSADGKYSLRNSGNLLQPIQMILSKNLTTFSQYFAKFLESTSNFKHFEKNDDPRSLCIFRITAYVFSVKSMVTQMI